MVSNRSSKDAFKRGGQRRRARARGRGKGENEKGVGEFGADGWSSALDPTADYAQMETEGRERAC